MVFASFVFLAGLALSLAAPQQRRQASGPVIGSNFQDPSVVQLADGSYVAYAGVNGNPAGSNVLIATSPDFSTWTVRYGYDALPNLPSWAASPPHVWAPDVTQLNNGNFVLYYSVVMAESPSKHCVAAAYAPNAEGPFTPVQTPLFCDLGAGGAIDADGFNDPTTNRQYVVYKVDGNSVGNGGACSNTVAPIAPTPLNLQEVSNDDGYTPLGGTSTILLNDPDDGPNIEAPSLTYDASSGTYILFYSSKCFTQAPYNIRYATSTSIYGPFTKQPNPFLVTGSTAANLYIPGGIDVTKDGKKAVFHGDTNMGWFAGDGSKRVRAMYALDLNFAGGAVHPGGLY
ncbi:hypothetical protein G647_03878 [Cladophialophora carrionii CBS 160.54]|uniref:Glycoside hydrolase family 43 protein n=1 Tax=Cladophialophora carrionii CBS 160.54 TaxID=1279043 RepID=V9DC84_9EURO|nr:uncharacterized protein G647_03878 [Cladophialophora carrionii CBS 160.54]ETI24509.1 hypothetical protein G647_03878 [Cladophialophora carrionii CBS 160.54]